VGVSRLALYSHPLRFSCDGADGADGAC
jgi:hypothetical protein